MIIAMTRNDARRFFASLMTAAWLTSSVVLPSASMADDAPAKPPFEVKVVADRLTVRARDVPLRDLLEAFQEAGVQVRMDTRINPRITANFADRDMYPALASLLAECDYGIVWSVVDGPAGRMKRISRIDVFKSGDRSHTQPLGDTTLKRAETPVNDKTVLVVKNELLLRLRSGVTLAKFQELLARIGGTVVGSVPQLGIYRIRLAPGTSLAEALRQLAASAEVAYAEPNFVYRTPSPSRTDSDGSAGRRTGRTDKTTGAPVAVLDTGLLPESGLGDNVVATLDVVDPERPISDPQGHGTQMALLATGAVLPMGVTDGAGGAVPVVAIKAFDDNGYASSASLMASMVFALDQKARVISLSWGSEADSRFVSEAVDYALAHGAVVVAAAGNEPTGRPFYPAACPGVLAVSALLPSGQPWPSSNYGDFVDLAAPGVAELPVGYNGPAGGYAGTSIAAAYTANTLSRYFALHPDADARQAITALNSALSRSGTGTRDPHLGGGRLDAAAVSAFLK